MWPTSSYDRWKTTDPNEVDDELYEILEEKFWEDLEEVLEHVNEYLADWVGDLLYGMKDLPEDHWFIKMIEEFKRIRIPSIIESRMEDAKYQI